MRRSGAKLVLNGEGKKEIKKGVYAAVGGFIVVGLGNAFSMYIQTQTFKDTTSQFIQAQTTRNEKQDEANEQFRIAIAELKQQSSDQSRRLEILENRTK